MRKAVWIGWALALALAGCEKNSSEETAITVVTPQEWAQNWPLFRGPAGDGHAAVDAAPPLEFDPARDVRWKTPVEAKGFSSPIVWGDRIYLSAEPNDVLAFDRTTGKQLWRRTLQAAPPPPLPEGEWPWEPGQAGLASPTPCTDGRRVYAFYGDGVLGCVDLAGKQVWARRLVDRPDSAYGLAASPIVHNGLIIQVVDLDYAEAEGKLVTQSFVVAVRAEDGQQVWRAERPVGGSWSTPLLVEHAGRTEMIIAASPWVIAYDPLNGKELWRCGGMAGDVVATPVVGDGLVLCASDPQGPLLAIRLGGSGDVTNTHVAWKQEHDMPDTASGVLLDRRYCHMSDASILSCFNALTGEELWRDEDTFRSLFAASPVAAAGRVYWPSEDGEIFVLDLAAAEADKRVLQTWKLDDKLYASPAIVDDQVILRGEKALYCIAPAPR